jgi:hypothetical protein
MATINLNISGLSAERIFLTANTTLTLLNGVDTQVLTLIVTQDSTGGHTLTFANASGTPSIATGANASTIMQLVYDAVTNSWITPSAAASGGSSLQSQATTFTAAQMIAAAGGTPQTILAGIAGKVIVALGFILEYKFGSAVFVISGGGGLTAGFAADIANDSSPIGTLSTGWLDQSVSQYFTANALDQNGPLSNYVGSPIVLSGNPSGGSISGGTGGQLFVTVLYTTITPS